MVPLTQRMREAVTAAVQQPSPLIEIAAEAFRMQSRRSKRCTGRVAK
jgi:hypothetical protein